MKKLMNILMLTGFVLLPGCSSELAHKYTERATIGYTTAIHDDLISLPPPREKIVLAAYKFRDQTGQYKTSAQATTFSTAVTQGATSMLVKALEDSGWFTVIERESLPNLLNERQIIRSTRTQYAAEGGGQLMPLPPLLYAGVLIEGGIIAYDTNLVTGGLGVAYFGVGGSGQFRKDQVTIYLRLVSTQNGQVLKSVSTTKAVLSREVDFNVYRFVRIKRLLETETGLSTNEPPSMCVLEAVEKAVYDLVIEGIQEGLWALKNPQDINHPAIQKYLQEKQKVEKIVTFDKTGKIVKVEDAKKPESLVEAAGPEPIEAPERPAPKTNEPKTILNTLESVIGEPEAQPDSNEPRIIDESPTDASEKPGPQARGAGTATPVPGSVDEALAKLGSASPFFEEAIAQLGAISLSLQKVSQEKCVWVRILQKKMFFFRKFSLTAGWVV